MAEGAQVLSTGPIQAGGQAGGDPPFDLPALAGDALFTAPLVLVVAIIALFWGWRMMLALTMLSLAVIIIGAGHRVLTDRVPWSVPLWLQGILGVAALVIVWIYLRPVHRLLAAVNGFVWLAALGALPGLLYDWLPLILIGALIGGVPGAWLGWRFIHYADSVVGACLGGMLLVASGLMAAKYFDVEVGLMGWVGLLLPAAILIPLGVIVQFKQLRRLALVERARAQRGRKAKDHDGAGSAGFAGRATGSP